jgi:hypothetical protein
LAGCDGGARPAPPTPSLSVSASPSPSPSPSPVERRGRAVVRARGTTRTLPEIACGVTRDERGAVLGFRALFGRRGEEVRVRLSRGYRGDGAYRSGVEYEFVDATGHNGGPAERLVVRDGGRAGTLTYHVGEATIAYRCDPGDDVAAVGGPAPADPRDVPATARLTDADGAVWTYTGVRCDGGRITGTGPGADSLTLETDGTSTASLRARHLGVEHVFANGRMFAATFAPGRIEFQTGAGGDTLAVVEWSCPA